ncbi:unnamed protein product [Hermetia illucens]|uniref:Uncharacterized protein n=1 Tax=Hermetia illucens TaxID=343691 RepID=A0A7R8YYW6_HERIL|nr:unnamed protein product [Hermetia illucens]
MNCEVCILLLEAQKFRIFSKLRDFLLLLINLALEINPADPFLGILQAYGEVEDIPLYVYKNMGWILSGISLDDLRNMTIDQGELIGIFGSAESLNDDQMDVIAQKVKSDWAGKTPDKYSEYDLEILGKILCYFNQSEILQIHPDAYRSKAEIIGKLNSCPHEIIESFAKLAVQTNAFGPPSTWSKLDISEIGVVIAGLSEKEYNSIKLENLTQNKRLYNQVINSRYPDANSTKPIQYSRVNTTKSAVSSSYLKRKEAV